MARLGKDPRRWDGIMAKRKGDLLACSLLLLLLAKSKGRGVQ